MADPLNNPGLVSDCDVLLTARDWLAGSAMLDWSARTPIGQWEGVTVGGTPLRVTKLNLPNWGLTGEIPPGLGRLSSLQELYMHENQLSGEIPEELGGLANLELLWLSGNRLSGEIPQELGSLLSLRWLTLRNNQLTGEIPVEFGGLGDLRSIILSQNQLTGEIPAELGGLAHLQTIDLSENRLAGEIPVELGGLARLDRMALSSNQLTGQIPAELGKLDDLFTLKLEANQLTGEIPVELGNLAKMDWLDLSSNQLTGQIPAELGGLTYLRGLFLLANRLTGPIPAELGGLANLDWLYLSRNQLTGCITEGLRDVARHDLHYLGLPFCDVLLSGLTINPGSLIPSFDPYRTDYTVAVGRSRVTVVPANDHNASLAVLDENNDAIEDADAALVGHQLDFSADVPAIKIRVVSQDNLATHTYTVRDLGVRYDANDNGVIERDEVIAAIVDYFADRISRVEAIGVVRLYFSS